MTTEQEEIQYIAIATVIRTAATSVRRKSMQQNRSDRLYSNDSRMRIPWVQLGYIEDLPFSCSLSSTEELNHYHRRREECQAKGRVAEVIYNKMVDWVRVFQDDSTHNVGTNHEF